LGFATALSSNAFVHSFTRTVSWNLGSLDWITCEKLGTTSPGPADYTDGNLSCPIGTQEV